MHSRKAIAGPLRPRGRHRPAKPRAQAPSVTSTSLAVPHSRGVQFLGEGPRGAGGSPARSGRAPAATAFHTHSRFRGILSLPEAREPSTTFLGWHRKISVTSLNRCTFPHVFYSKYVLRVFPSTP